MATQNLTFTATAGTLYQVAPEARQLDILDHLLQRLQHLTAMCHVAIDGTFFQGCGEAEGVAYVDACRSLADECNELTELLGAEFESVGLKIDGLAAGLSTAGEDFVKNTAGLTQGRLMAACEAIARECYDAIRALCDVRVAA